MSKIRDILQLKSKGMSYADIARLTGIRKQEISVLMKYIRNDEELRDDLKKVEELSKILTRTSVSIKELNSLRNKINELEQTNIELINKLDEKEELIKKYKVAYRNLNNKFKGLKEEYTRLKKSKCFFNKLLNYLFISLLTIFLIGGIYYYSKSYVYKNYLVMELPFGIQILKERQ